MKSILVGVDGSDEAKAAVRLAVLLAPALGANVQLAHVVRPHPPWAPTAMKPHALTQRRATEVLEATARESASPNTNISVRILHGEAGAALAEAAQAPEVALLVVGSRGADQAARVLLGSSADRAIQQSEKPVLVVKRDSAPPSKGRCILVGVDGSAESYAAAHFAADLAEATGASLRVCFVVEEQVSALPNPFAPSTGEADIQHKDWATALLREVVAREKRPSLVVDTSMPVGRPAEMLAELSLEEEVALIVIGHRGRGGVARFLLGSTADRLAQIASKPVLIVR